jgi:hypothetical protein
MDSFDLRMIVTNFLDSCGKTVKTFKSNLPGHTFIYSFLNWHKQSLTECAKIYDDPKLQLIVKL